MTDITITVPPEAHRAFLAVAPEPSESETAVLANPAHFMHAEALLRKALRENPQPPERVPVEAGQRRQHPVAVVTVVAVDGDEVWVRAGTAHGTHQLADVESWPLVEPVHVPGTRVGDPLTPDTPPGAKVQSVTDKNGTNILTLQRRTKTPLRPGWWMTKPWVWLADDAADFYRVVALPGDGAS